MQFGIRLRCSVGNDLGYRDSREIPTESPFSNVARTDRQVRRSHGLPGLVHRLDVFLGFHSQCGNTRAALVGILHGVFFRVGGCTLVGWRSHALHPLAHGRMRVRVSMRMGMRMRSGVEEAVTGVAGLQALSWTHEVGDAVDWCGAGERRGQPRVQGEGVGHGGHAGVNWCRPVKGQHGGVVELHGAGVHLFLTTPFRPAVLEPDLGDEHEARLE